PEGTLKSRLERGRRLLHARLTRRGLTLSAGLGATLLSPAAPAAVVPLTLAEASVRVACLGVSAGVLSAEIHALAQGVCSTMTLTKLQLAAAVVLAAGLLVAGAGTAAHQVWAAKQPAPQSAERPKPVTPNA